MNFGNTYLGALYRHSKKLCVAVIVFCCITVILTLKGYELTPFFVWGMFSQKQDRPQYVEMPGIILNDSVTVNNTRKRSPSTNFLLTSTTGYYVSIKQNGGTDPFQSFFRGKLKKKMDLLGIDESAVLNGPERVQQFLPWLARYCAAVTGIDVRKIEIVNDRLKLKDGIISLDSSYSAGAWIR